MTRFDETREKRPRGVEAALLVVREMEDGAFASEALRRIGAQMDERERTLAASLVYSFLRRLPLWEHLLERLASRPIRAIPRDVENALLIGIAGLFSLRTFASPVLVSALVSWTRHQEGEPSARLVNAVLRHALENGGPILAQLSASSLLSDQALFHGVPGWVAKRFEEDWGTAGARALVRMSRIRPYIALRCSPGTSRDEIAGRAALAGVRAWPSPLLACSLRTACSAHPPSLPGFLEGEVTPQSEASMLVGEIAARTIRGGRVLDMCAGRGGKTGHLAQVLPNAQIEAWERSSGRGRAFAREMERLRLDVPFTEGDALEIVPDGRYRLVVVDAPCSGSGTWNRHPDGKERITAQDVHDLAETQRRLLSRAVDLVEPGGYVLYATCSLFREENEHVVADVLTRRTEMVEVPLEGFSFLRRGKPWGHAAWPSLPWLDGFYVTLLLKRRSAP